MFLFFLQEKKPNMAKHIVNGWTDCTTFHAYQDWWEKNPERGFCVQFNSDKIQLTVDVIKLNGKRFKIKFNSNHVLPVNTVLFHYVNTTYIGLYIDSFLKRLQFCNGILSIVSTEPIIEADGHDEPMERLASSKRSRYCC